MIPIRPFTRFLAIGSLFVTSPAQALVIRHDTPTLDYENYGSWDRFNASCAIVRANDSEFGISGATAIDSRWGVHARHTLKSVQDWMDGGNGARLKGSKWSGWNYQGLSAVAVEQVIFFDDDFTRFGNAIDIAVVQTKFPCTALRIAPLFAGWDEVGKVGSGASAANNRQDGNGNSRKGEAAATSASGRWYEARWAGKNDINQVNGQALGSPANALLKCDFDHPTNTSKSTMGGTTAIDLEYGQMNGDSGSPIYADRGDVIGQVAGVLSGGTGNTYGSTAVYVRIRPYKTWITDTLLANPDTRTLTLNPIADRSVLTGETLSLTAVANSSDSPPLTVSYKLVNPPTGATINAATGAISWTPAASTVGTTRIITVEASENGVVGKKTTTSFSVTIEGEPAIPFWNWTAAPASWSEVTIGGGSSFNLTSPKFPYLQGDQNNLIYQQVPGTIPAWATVTVKVKIADFHQTWSDGGPVRFGFFTTTPTTANASSTAGNGVFPYASPQTSIPDFNNASELTDGFTNAGGDDEYSFSFTTNGPLTDPYFVVRKEAVGDRFGVDDVSITYTFPDADEDGLADAQETFIGTNPNLADTDGDGLDDGDELAIATNPLLPDTDEDGYADGYEVDTLGTSPIDPAAPDAPDTLAIGINFVSSTGAGIGIGLPPNAAAGEPDVAQRNWNQTSPLGGQSGSTANIATPAAGTLVDSHGTPTSATLTFSMPNAWSMDNEDLTPYGKLFAGYLDSSTTTNCSVTLNGIPYQNYEVHVYVGAGTNGRTGRITDGTTTYSFTTAASTTTPGDYLRTDDTGTGYPTANYAVFSNKSGPSLTLTYLRGNGNGGIQALQIVPITLPSAYETWATSHDLDPNTDGAPDADADADGYDNATEFALFSLPDDPTSRPVLEVAKQGGSASFTYTKSKAADGWTIAAEWSNDLDHWHSDDLTEIQLSQDIDTRKMEATLGLTAPSACYFRLRITQP